MKITVCKDGSDIITLEFIPSSRADMYKEYIIEKSVSGFDLHSRYDNLKPTWIGYFGSISSVTKWFESKTGKPAPEDFTQSL